MQDLFKLYCSLHHYKELNPEIVRKEIDRIKNTDNFLFLEIVYSFFMLGYEIREIKLN